MLNFDFLSLVDQFKKFLRREKGSSLALLGFWVLAFLAWEEILLKFFPDLGEKFGQNGFYALGVAGTIAWLWSRRLPLPRDKITVGIAPFEVVSIEKTLTGDEHYDISHEIVEHIYTTLHHFREKLGFTDFLHFEKLPDRVDPDFRTAQKWTKNLGVGALIWGAVRVETDGTAQKMVLEPQFNFLREPANRFYEHFRKSLNQLHQFPIDFDEDEDESAILFYYIVFVAMLFAGITETGKKNFDRAEKIYAAAMTAARDKASENRTLHDILLNLEFFRARALHSAGNLLAARGDLDAANEKFIAAEEILFSRAEEISKNLGDAEELEKLEHSYLYGVYLLAKSGKPKEAEARLRAIAGEIPEAELDLQLAKIYKRIDPDRAEKLFKKALDAGKSDEHFLAEAREEMGRFYLQSEHFRRAATQIEAKFATDEMRPYEPELFDDEGRRELARAYFAQHRLIRAARDGVRAAIDSARNRASSKISG